MNVFLCHSSHNSSFVREVWKYLQRSFEYVYCFEECQLAGESFVARIGEELERCEGMVVFIGARVSPWQISEANRAYSLHMEQPKRKRGTPKSFIFVYLDGMTKANLPAQLNLPADHHELDAKGQSSSEAFRIAKEIAGKLGQSWHSDDDLPDNPYLFGYEKDIIAYFIKKARLDARIAAVLNELDRLPLDSQDCGELSNQYEALRKEYDESILPAQKLGCPAAWPSVHTYFDDGDLREAKSAKLQRQLREEPMDAQEHEQKRAELAELSRQPQSGPTLAGQEVMAEPRLGADLLAGTKVGDAKYPLHENRVSPDLIGTFRSPDAGVVAAALSSFHREYSLTTQGLIFPEAGPREFLFYPSRPGRSLKVGILVSGGIAPGTNAVIDGITQRHYMYAKKSKHSYDLTVVGYKNGFQGLRFREDEDVSRRILTPEITSGHASEGGSLLGTSRYEDLLQDRPDRDAELANIVRFLRESFVDILYIIGGDGSMRAAHAIWSYANQHPGRRLSVVAIPKTMDNDILWVWQTFGFLSAVERARELIEHLGTEVTSNPRLGVVQLFGSDSGFVVSHAVLASKTGLCDAALIPEVDFSIKKLASHLKQRMAERAKDQHGEIPSGFVVMAEAAIPTDALEFIEDEDIGLSRDEKKAVLKYCADKKEGKRIEGQTDDELRTAGLKIVSRGLLKRVPPDQTIPEWKDQPSWDKLRIVTNEPRHLLRATPPATADIITAQRLGLLAVDNALAGYTDFMVSQWLTEYVLVPLKLIALGRKRIPTGGIFWKSVLAKTGQPSELA
jgi:6-phosphofructokinase 1